MIRSLFTVIVLLLAMPATAQQQPPDAAFLQRAIAVLQAQRNQALDGEVAWRAQYEGLVDQLAKAKARIAELEKPTEKEEPKQ